MLRPTQFALTAMLGLAPSSAWTEEIAPGAYEVVLEAQNGEAIPVAKLVMSASTNGQMTYEVDWDDTKFSDQFLSMRPFKCLDGAKKQWCRVPYPYENKRRLSADDVTDLEYDLLFIWKRQGDYGIDMWNGVYYELELTADGLKGAMNEMDMDILSAPPDDGNLRPIGEFDLEPADPDSHWLPRVLIRKE